ncbi:hypothetical protein [Neotabrizicola sp. VNH66]
MRGEAVQDGTAELEFRELTIETPGHEALPRLHDGSHAVALTTVGCA